MLRTLAPLLVCLPWMGAALTWDTTVSGVTCGGTYRTDRFGQTRKCPMTAGESIVGTGSCGAMALATWSGCKAKCEACDHCRGVAWRHNNEGTATAKMCMLCSSSGENSFVPAPIWQFAAINERKLPNLVAVDSIAPGTNTTYPSQYIGCFTAASDTTNQRADVNCLGSLYLGTHVRRRAKTVATLGGRWCTDWNLGGGMMIWEDDAENMLGLSAFIASPITTWKDVNDWKGDAPRGNYPKHDDEAVEAFVANAVAAGMSSGDIFTVTSTDHSTHSGTSGVLVTVTIWPTLTLLSVPPRKVLQLRPNQLDNHQWPSAGCDTV